MPKEKQGGDRMFSIERDDWQNQTLLGLDGRSGLAPKHKEAVKAYQAGKCFLG